MTCTHCGVVIEPYVMDGIGPTIMRTIYFAPDGPEDCDTLCDPTKDQRHEPS